MTSYLHWPCNTILTGWKIMRFGGEYNITSAREPRKPVCSTHGRLRHDQMINVGETANCTVRIRILLSEWDSSRSTTNLLLSQNLMTLFLFDESVVDLTSCISECGISTPSISNRARKNQWRLCSLINM